MLRISTTALAGALLACAPAAAHDWYTHRKDPVTLRLCCGGKECRPLADDEVQALADGGYVATERRWSIPRERVQQSPDGRYHICEGMISHADRPRYRLSYSFDWLCFFAPPDQVASVR